MKKFLFTAALVAGALSASAADAYIGGIYYSLDATDNTACIQSIFGASPSTPLTGDVVVPPTVEYGGNTYTVVGVLEGAFDGRDHTGLKSVTLPNTLEYLDDGSFQYCPFTELVIPDNVSIIGSEVFNGSSKLAKVTFGTGLTRIGRSIFTDCWALTSVTCLAATPPSITPITFNSSIKSQVTLTVPFGKADTYKNAANWSGFKEYVEQAQGPGVGIESIAIGEHGAVRYFNMQGIEVVAPEKGQILIRVAGDGSKVVKF